MEGKKNKTTLFFFSNCCRYFPAAPVSGTLGNLTTASNNGCEAFLELQKALNVVGDYRLSSSVTSVRWGAPFLATIHTQDYELNSYYTVATGGSILANNPPAAPFGGLFGAACYCAAIDLETSNGVEISGLNAEEQSDISFIATWNGAQQTGYTMTVYAYYDAMLILRENNVLELIQ